MTDRNRTEWLSRDEVADLTGKKYYPAQARALRRMRIDVATYRLDGSPVVLRSALGEDRGHRAPPKGWQPNLEGINGSAQAKH